MSTVAKFLFDECLGKPMMEELRKLVPEGCEFAHILDHFSSGTHDDEWIPAMKEQGWVVISADSGKNRPSKGGKLPRLCKENEITPSCSGQNCIKDRGETNSQPWCSYGRKS